ncbi:MAG TPA: efflux RND transporter periplasmic adaptor subunit [Dongiaceae bacterium]|nr:efflux RND transporter periplasmic adaptor subunit [Dongiaceae bacterium]
MRIERHDLVQTVVASGRVETPYRVNVASQITGTVAEIPVEEGQSVKSGDVLIRLDDREAEAAVVQAEGAVAEAQARLRQIRDVSLPSAEETLKQAQATLTNVQQSYDREVRLYGAGFATKADLDAAQKDLDVAETQLRSAQLQVANNRNGGSAYVMTQNQLDQAQSALAAAQVKLSYTVIKAPADGTLITRDVERGNVVQAGDTLMTLSPAGETRLVLDIDEKNLGALQLGQPALASADAYPDQTFPAELVYINPYVDPNQGSVTVKLSVPHPPAYLVQDMTVSVDIETARRANALIVPLTAVHDTLTGSPWVWRVADGKVTKQAIKLGARGDAKAEVLEGLKDGDLIVAAGAAAVAEGQRVRPVGP